MRITARDDGPPRFREGEVADPLPKVQLCGGAEFKGETTSVESLQPQGIKPGHKQHEPEHRYPIGREDPPEPFYEKGQRVSPATLVAQEAGRNTITTHHKKKRGSKIRQEGRDEKALEILLEPNRACGKAVPECNHSVLRYHKKAGKGSPKI